MFGLLDCNFIGYKEDPVHPHDDNLAVFSQRNELNDDESVPPSFTRVLPEDVILEENEAAWNASTSPFDDDSAPPYHQNESKRLLQNRQSRGKKSMEMMRVFIPPELEPARRVKVHYPNGTTLRTAVPPRSKWLYKTCNGRIQSFFVVPIPHDLAQKPLRPSSRHSQQRNSRRTQDVYN